MKSLYKKIRQKKFVQIQLYMFHNYVVCHTSVIRAPGNGQIVKPT